RTTSFSYGFFGIRWPAFSPCFSFCFAMGRSLRGAPGSRRAGRLSSLRDGKRHSLVEPGSREREDAAIASTSVISRSDRTTRRALAVCYRLRRENPGGIDVVVIRTR